MRYLPPDTCSPKVLARLDNRKHSENKKYSGVKISESQKGEEENYLSMIDGTSLRGLKSATDIYCKYTILI